MSEPGDGRFEDHVALMRRLLTGGITDGPHKWTYSPEELVEPPDPSIWADLPATYSQMRAVMRAARGLFDDAESANDWDARLATLREALDA